MRPSRQEDKLVKDEMWKLIQAKGYSTYLELYEYFEENGSDEDEFICALEDLENEKRIELVYRVKSKHEMEFTIENNNINQKAR